MLEIESNYKEEREKRAENLPRRKKRKACENEASENQNKYWKEYCYKVERNKPL